MAFDFSELFTAAVRDVAAAARRRSLVLSFDCRGPPASLPGESGALHDGVHRLLCGVIDLVADGMLIADAELALHALGGGRVALRLVGMGELSPPGEVDAAMRRLLLEDCGSEDRPHHAAGSCPRTGAAIELTVQVPHGVLIEMHLECREIEATQAPAPQRRSFVHAWVIDPNRISGGALERRLQRLGWASTLLASPAQAIDRLRDRHSASEMPSLAIIAESAAFPTRELLALRRLVPEWTECLYVAEPGSPLLGAHDAMPGFAIEALPLSPRTLESLAARPWPQAGLPPARHPMADRPRLLVVDDDRFDRIVATHIAQCLGHEVASAADGPEAIEACLRDAPAVILMDLDMPRMNGIEAAGCIHMLQRLGELPPCRILATAAHDDPDLRRACAAAGIDGYLLKPLALEQVHDELRRAPAVAPP